jgi:hypothetical protein
MAASHPRQSKEKVMKTFLKPIVSILAVASLLAAGGAFAQQQQRGGKNWHKGPPSVEEKLARISAALDLSDEQSAEMLAVLQEAESNKEALHQRTMEIMGAEICAQKARAEEAILAILDTEQAELFLQMKEDRPSRAHNRTRSRKDHDAPDCSEYAGGDS